MTGGTGDIRLFDVTNSQQIAVCLDFGTTLSIVADASLTNLPTGQAIFEVQVKSDAGGGNNARVCAALLQFPS